MGNQVRAAGRSALLASPAIERGWRREAYALVHHVVAADGLFHEKEEALAQAIRYLLELDDEAEPGWNVDALCEHARGKPVSPDAIRGMLHLALLASWIDGRQVAEERAIIDRFADAIGAPPRLVTELDGEIRRSLLRNALIEAIPELLIASPAAAAHAEGLGLDKSDLVEAARSLEVS
jgi:tellurite resistance protein